ncbi:MAG: LysR family transcriptional regulator [Oscillospiraceae bacterium]|nr:LysR family transcriptional regulator [Oscillospiraceae bacterium]
MDIQHIRYFLAVTEHQSFSKAAEKLYVTQPILTRCVKNLEKELGVQLIERSTKHFALTEAGQVLVRQGTQLLQQHKDIYRQMEDLAGGHAGELRISGPGVLLDMYFPKLVAQYRKANPGIRITIRESGTRTVVQEVMDGTADIGLVMLPLTEGEDLDVVPIVADEVHVLMHRDHPLASQTSIHIRQLDGLDIITYNQSTTLYHALSKLCREEGFSPNIACQSMMPGFILDTLGCGDWVGVFPAPMLRQAHRANLVSIPLTPQFPWQIAMVTKKGRYLSRATESFLNFTQSFLNTL